jgi:DNA (cytosine-5)-methyltransferase 1
MSYREAARFQSFPDSFVFQGAKSSIAKQIGNAVPPLLAYQIAKSLGEPGCFVDLFSGAGGMGLGFTWAGWEPVVANDIDESFLLSYRANVHDQAFAGDIREPAVSAHLVRAIRSHRRRDRRKLWILGGPPCQGFSTAGKPRTMEDDRNQLFWDYKKLVEATRPDGFVFENVKGLLSMEGGRVYQMIRNELSSVMPCVAGWVLGSEEYGVPQRRSRVFLIGSSAGDILAPSRISSVGIDADLFSSLAPAITAEDAIGDLPSLNQGEDGSTKPYLHSPLTAYQRLMRSKIGPEQFLNTVIRGKHP